MAMIRPRLLDLFCGAGGAAMGYHRAGFDVVGVDIKPQPRYPFEFHKADALTFPLDGFDAVHASPLCRDHTALAGLVGLTGTGWMVAATRARLQPLPVPWVIENVPGAPLVHPLVICGTEFGLRTSDGYHLRRHRLFESNIALWGAGGCHCARKRIGGVYGKGGYTDPEQVIANGHRGRKMDQRRAQEIMRIDWMTGREMSQAIPPAYTEHIGAQLLDHLRSEAA